MKTRITFSLFAVLFLFRIANAQTIETIGMGVYQTGTSTLTFTDMDNIDHVVVEAIYKATEYYVTPNEVVFSDGDESYTVNANPVENIYTQNGTGYNLSPGYYQATFNTVDAGGITLDQLTNLGHIHSFVAYVYRNVDNGFESIANMDHDFFFWNGASSSDGYIFPLDAVAEPRDISAKVTITELSPIPDERIAVITVSAGGISITDTIANPDPDLGNALNIVPFTLLDVPGDATEVTITIYSPDSPYNSGDSFISGGVVLDVESPAPPNAPEICTLKQTFYGNYNETYNGQTTSELLFDLLATDLVLGIPGHSLTLTQANADCLIDRLPGGGKARKIHADATCDNPVGIQLRPNGRFKNGLLSQAITLGLNLRLDPDLGSLLLSDISFLLHNRILQKMDANATVNDLFLLANTALGGGNTLGIGKKKLRNGMRAINAYFVGCVTLQPGDDCGTCDGQMTSLSLKYLGNECNATVRVYKNHISCSNIIATFSGVYAGDTLNFTGTGYENKLGAKVKITIDDNYCNITEVHTSCSQPIEVGMVYNDEFLLVAGTSLFGGPLCDDGLKSGGIIDEELQEARIIVPETSIFVYPNPIVSESTVDFEVSESGITTIEILNIQGQVIKQLYNGNTEVGDKYSVVLKAGDMDKGIYFLKMVIGAETIIEKISISE